MKRLSVKSNIIMTLVSKRYTSRKSAIETLLLLEQYLNSLPPIVVNKKRIALRFHFDTLTMKEVRVG